MDIQLSKIEQKPYYLLYLTLNVLNLRYKTIKILSNTNI